MIINTNIQAMSAARNFGINTKRRCGQNLGPTKS